MEFNFCFICMSTLKQVAVKTGRKKKGEGVKSSKSFKFLLEYLLQTTGKTYDLVLKDILELSQSGEDEEVPKSKFILRLCNNCELIGERILELHLELEKLQMIIVSEVRSVRETIQRSSGWLRGGMDDGDCGTEKTFEDFARKFCHQSDSSRDEQQRIFSNLKGFQTAVSEIDKDSVHVPLVYLKKCGIPERIPTLNLMERSPIIVKTEQSQDEDDNLIQDDSYADYFNHDESDNHSKVSSTDSEPDPNAPKKLSNWKKIKKSDETLKTDFRKRNTVQFKGFHQTVYYCAHGQTGRCPVQIIKVKEFPNGSRTMFQNSCAHQQHRTEPAGLTNEQKEFVEDCIRKGVNKPAGILQSFEHLGIPVPARLKLQNYLQRLRKKISSDEVKKPVRGKGIPVTSEDDSSSLLEADMKPEIKSDVLSSSGRNRAPKETHQHTKRGRGRPRLNSLDAHTTTEPKAEERHETKWKKIEISDETLKTDFRVQSNMKMKGSKVTLYYCAYGKGGKLCPVKIKIIELPNGVQTILKSNCDHGNHRSEHVGLTKEQREFVEDCIRKGVNKPVGILESFRHFGMPEPTTRKLQNFLLQVRRKSSSGQGEDQEVPGVSKDGLSVVPVLNKNDNSHASKEGSDSINYEAFSKYDATSFSEAGIKSEVGDGSMEVSPVASSSPINGSAQTKTQKSHYSRQSRKGWRRVNMSDEQLAREFRVMRRPKTKGSSVTLYYCAFSKAKKCLVRLKIKTLANGVSLMLLNNEDHTGHREGTRGLPPEERQFVTKCLAEGVTTPMQIMAAFRNAGLGEPDYDKLINWLARVKKMGVPVKSKDDLSSCGGKKISGGNSQIFKRANEDGNFKFIPISSSQPGSSNNTCKVEKKYICEECGKAFQRIQSLRSHKYLHQEKRFKCQYCSKAFTVKVYLKRHIRTHTGEKPYQCDGCGKAQIRVCLPQEKVSTLMFNRS